MRSEENAGSRRSMSISWILVDTSHRRSELSICERSAERPSRTAKLQLAAGESAPRGQGARRGAPSAFQPTRPGTHRPADAGAPAPAPAAQLWRPREE
eukprot:2396974-Prymnesium_polylepis.1